MQDAGRLPVDLAQMAPGAGLAGVLEGVEVGAVADEALLELLAAEYRQLSHAQARVWAVMAELTRRAPLPAGPEGPVFTAQQVFDIAVDEVRAELRLTRQAALTELEAATAVEAVPAVAAGLRAGRLDRRRALVLAQGCADLRAEHTDALVAAVLGDAGALTATGLAERVRKVATALDPAWAERRYRRAVRGRKLVGYLAAGGCQMACVNGSLS
jgi:hypothetical protein